MHCSVIKEFLKILLLQCEHNVQFSWQRALEGHRAGGLLSHALRRVASCICETCRLAPSRPEQQTSLLVRKQNHISENWIPPNFVLAWVLTLSHRVPDSFLVSYSHSLSELMMLCISLFFFGLNYCVVSVSGMDSDCPGGDPRKKPREWRRAKSQKEGANEWVTTGSTWGSVALVSL